MEEHEKRARTSSLYETLKKLESSDINIITNWIKNSEIYKDLDNISKLKGENCLNFLKNKYTDFDDILKEFVEYVFLKNSILVLPISL